MKIKSLRNGEITLSMTDIGRKINMSFNAIRENKVLAKISGFTVYVCVCAFGFGCAVQCFTLNLVL